MARKNRSTYAILGILNLSPGTGYDIKKYSDEVLSCFWNENFGHIYPTLRKMLDEGSVEIVNASSREKKIVYGITDKGRREFAAWLAADTERQPVRSEFLLKLLFSSVLPRESVVATLARDKARHEAQIEAYQTMRDDLLRGIPEVSKDRVVFLNAVLRRGIMSSEAAIRWCDETIEEMRRADILETTGQDWANHLSHAVSGNGMICLVAALSRKPDAATLRAAVADLIGMQPVLGCRFDETREPPVWVPVEGEEYFREATADSLREGLDALMQSAPAQGRQMDATLLSTPDQTAICLRLNHAATDGSGAKRCLALLAKCYEARLQGRAMAGASFPDRSDGQVYARCGIADYRALLRRDAQATEPIATLPYTGTDGRTVCCRWVILPLSSVKRAEGTVNDRLLAAYILALSRICAESCAITAHMTIDLRRYLAEETAPAACNLSGMAAVRVSVDPQSSYADILARTQERTALLKAGHIGLSSAAMTTYLRTMPYQKVKGALLDAGQKSRASGVAAPLLSNLGLIAPDNITFGEATVTDVIPLLPAMHAPSFMLGASGYGGMLTLSAAYYAEERPSDAIDALLRDIKETLES